jgi:predicted O-methyltransferase YrrM
MELKEIVDNKFNIPASSITPIMARLLYMLSSIKNPEMLISVGISCGNTFVWNAGPFISSKISSSKSKIIGIDIDSESIKIAKENFSNFKGCENIELITEDALNTIDRLDFKIDYLYLDADNMDIGKGLYLQLLLKTYPKLNKGAWVLAHDATFYYFKDQLKEYLEYVRNKEYFSESICFDVDPYGLELSIK